jgi:hypothetical protein
MYLVRPVVVRMELQSLGVQKYFGRKQLRRGLLKFEMTYFQGRAIAQAVSRRLLTAEARFRAQNSQWGFCGGQSGTGTGFIQVLRFSPVTIIPAMLYVHASSRAAWFNWRPADHIRPETTCNQAREIVCLFLYSEGFERKIVILISSVASRTHMRLTLKPYLIRKFFR